MVGWTRLAAAAMALGAAYLVAFPLQCGDPKKSLCVSRIRRLTVSLLMYAADNDYRMCDAARWTDVAAATIANKNTLHCPDLINPDKDRYGYAFNDRFSNRPLIESDKDSKFADRIMLYDSTNLARNAHDPLRTMAKGWNDPDRRIGNMFASVAYFDTHIELWANGERKP